MFISISSTIGLDISDHILRAILLKKSGKKNLVKSFASFNLPAGLILNGIIKDEQKIIEVFKKFFKTCHFPFRRVPVVASLPETHAFIKTIALEEGVDIKNEMPKHIPFPFNEVSVDVLVHKTLVIKDKTYILKSFAAVKKVVAQSYTTILESSGAHICALEIESQSLARLFINQTNLKEVQIIVDVGRNHTTFAVIKDDHIDFTHTSSFYSGQKLTENLSAELKCSPEEAEQQKITNTSNPVIKQIIEQYARELSTELDKVIKFHQEHIFMSEQCEYLIELTGGGSQLPYLAQYLEEKVRCPVHEAKIPKNINVPSKLKPLISSYATAIGLAMRNF